MVMVYRYSTDVANNLFVWISELQNLILEFHGQAQQARWLLQASSLNFVASGWSRCLRLGSCVGHCGMGSRRSMLWLFGLGDVMA